jgi:hypothetical protein
MSKSDIMVSIKVIGDAFNVAMENAARSIQRFGESVDRAIKDSEQRLAQRFSEQQGSPIKTVEWADGGDGNTLWVVTLANHRKLVGMGAGQLDALAAAEKAMER